MKLIGTGSALPRKVVSNDDLSLFLDTSDEWIFPRTGIRTRHVISDEKIEDLGAEAARKALDMAGLSPADIDFFICSNVVSEYMTPGLSCVISHLIGLTCPCIDINCACPGFIYAMDIAETYFAVGKVKNVLIVCAEEPTRMTSWEDRATCVLFGDGAGAAVFTGGDKVKAIKLNAEPSPDKICQVRRLMPTPFITKTEMDTPLLMNGRDVFRMAVTSSCSDIDFVLQKAGLQPDDIDLYLLHQANLRIIEAIRNHVNQPEEKFPSNIQRYGNTSSASIPILLDELSRDGRLAEGSRLLLSAFGAGFVTGACVMEWHTVQY